MATKRRIFCVEVFRPSRYVGGSRDPNKQCALSFARAAKTARAEVEGGAVTAHVTDAAGRASLSCFRKRDTGRVKCDASSVMRMAGSYQHVHLVAGDPAAGLRRKAYGGYPD